MKRPSIFLFLLTVCSGGALAQQRPYTPEQSACVVGWQQHFETPAPPVAMYDSSLEWLRWKTVSNYTFGKDRGSLPMIADLDALHPFFRDKVRALIQVCKDKGIELAIVESYRTYAKQNEYKSMGKKYTRSGGGHSKHQYGLAVDVVPMKDSVAVWDNLALWRKVGVAGEKLGLRWGGRWRHPFDPGHFEWTGGLTSYQLASGIFPTPPKPSYYPCLDEEVAQLKKQWAAWETEQAATGRAPARYLSAQK